MGYLTVDTNSCDKIHLKRPSFTVIYYRNPKPQKLSGIETIINAFVNEVIELLINREKARIVYDFNQNRFSESVMKC